MKKKILLIDDTKEFRVLVKAILSKKYEVIDVDNGHKAISHLIKGYKPDAIVSDLIMPGMDGKTLLSEIKSSEHFRKIPVIILSSIDKSSERVELLKRGASDYIIKPFNPAELEVRIDRILEYKATV